MSIEGLQDWPQLESDLAQLIADGRDVIDATVFLSGAAGSYQPIGVFGGDATYSLAVAQRVQTAAAEAFAVGDPWLLKAAIAPSPISLLPATAPGRLPGPPEGRVERDGHRRGDGHEAHHRRRLEERLPGR